MVWGDFKSLICFKRYLVLYLFFISVHSVSLNFLTDTAHSLFAMGVVVVVSNASKSVFKFNNFLPNLPSSVSSSGVISKILNIFTNSLIMTFEDSSLSKLTNKYSFLFSSNTPDEYNSSMILPVDRDIETE